MSRVELWVERRGGRPAVNPVMNAVSDLLGRLGHDVEVVVPEDRLVADAPGAGPDLVLLKTTTPAALAAATVVQAAGTTVLNDAAASVAMADKAFALARVAAAGVPVPATLLLPDDAPGVPVPAGAVPAVPRPDGVWVRKPVGGVHGWGVGVHAGLGTALTARTDTAGAPAGAVRSSVLVQEHVGGDTTDVKVYAVRGTLFAGRKPFSRTSFTTDDIEPVELTAAERAACVAAGEACGLVLYGVDLRRDVTGSTVVDVNAFPGYRGFDAAVPALADAVLEALGRPR